ncbi:hypothetical protein C4J81_18580 (plasmid) [Deltaproteobacteria bacterium Smac51]|nr:hypothetical protein C4J81_18580 [Deltaproteobacteria bacterium Smac51]
MIDFLLLYGAGNRPISDAVTGSFIGRSIGECGFPYAGAVYELSPGRDRFGLFCFSGQPGFHLARTEDGQALQFFDGTLIQESIRCDINELEPLSSKSDETGHQGEHGVYALGLFSQTGPNHIHRDVLGCYPLFIGLAPDLFAVSNSPALIAQAMKAEKNVLSPAALVLGLGPWDNETAYSQVFYCPQNSGILIDERNRPSYFSLCDDFYEPADAGTWKRLYELAYEKMMHWGEIVAKQETAALSDLTGGYDSRVALSVAAALGVHKEITWHVHGPKDDPDVIVAGRIAKMMDLKLDWTPEPPRGRARDPEDFYYGARRFLHRTSGGKSLLEVYISDDAAPPRNWPELKFTGNSGEMFKSYYAKWFLKQGRANGKIDHGLMELAVDSLLDKKPVIAMLKPENLRHYQTAVQKSLSFPENLYDIDLLYNYTYISRLHMGNAQRYHSNGPLPVWLGHLSLLHKLTYTAPAQWHAAQGFLFSLIERNCPDLMKQPFAGLIWQHPLGYCRRPDAFDIYKLEPVMPQGNGPIGPARPLAGQWIDIMLDKGFTFNPELAGLFQEDLLMGYFSPVFERKPCPVETIYDFVCFMGISMFMDGLALAPEANLTGPAAVSAASLPLGRKQRLYRPNPSAFREPAAETAAQGTLFFQKDKKFRSGNRQTLGSKETLIVELVREHRKRGI